MQTPEKNLWVVRWGQGICVYSPPYVSLPHSNLWEPLSM